ncbi:hypothetical protein AALP_AA3G280500 [Arabis alpina]|uniref:Small acidic protein 1 n=1 Tax=Arabis alpina TaxID=50452 RepID=A0A087HC76_ARAAL|nr:hypothetical protein AALP_AA3G280500 [Arabis alpina]
MRPTMHREFLAEMGLAESSMGMPMDVDDDVLDFDSVDTFSDGRGLFSSGKKLEDANFYNRFEDDFDDSDIN